MRVVVTGAAGFIGSHLVDDLLARGDEVLALDSLSPYYDPSLKLARLEAAASRGGCTTAVADLATARLEPLLEGAGLVFHLAGRPGVRASWHDGLAACMRENIHATQRLLDAAARAGVPRVVLASSSSVYGQAAEVPTPETAPLRPLSPYGVTKAAAEHVAALAACPVVVLRFFTVFGPRQRPDMAFARFLEAALEGRAVPVNGSGLQARDFTYVGDAVAALLAAAELGVPGRAYNVAGGCEATVLDVIGALGRLLGAPLDTRHGPASLGDPFRTEGDTARARRELGWEPEVGLEEGLARQLAAQAAPQPRPG